jgi:transposase
MNILALDIGKYKTVFCDYVCESGEHKFGRDKTTPQAIHDLIVSKQPEKVVMEVCSIAGWIVDIARVLGKETEVANTSHDAWRWKNVKKKTDREDALKLAKLSAMNQIPTVHVPAKKVREHRSLIKYRQRLVKNKTSIQNSIRAIFSGQGISGVPKGKSAWTKEELACFRSYAKPLGKIKDIEQLWRGRLYSIACRLVLELLQSTKSQTMYSTK